MSFDGNTYRKNVLARLLNEPDLADPQTGDPFLVCAVDPDADDETAQRQFGDVVAFWNKESNHPRYRGIASQLAKRKSAYAAVLLNSQSRAEARARVVGSREAAAAEALEVLDELAGRLITTHKGVPRSRLDTLRRIGTSRGVDTAAFDKWVAQQTIIEDAEAVPWEQAVRKQVRRSLDELAGLDGNPAHYRTLYSLLGLPHNAPADHIRAAADEVSRINAGARHDRRKTLISDLVATVRTRLLTNDGPPRYHASILADARELINPEIETLAVVTGEISAADHQALVAALVGKGWGLSAAESRDVIRQVAAASGASVATGAEAGDLVVCPNCHRPQSGAADACRYCGAELYLQCPSCSTRQPAAAVACPNCGTSFALVREVAARITAAQRALAEGRPMAALAELDAASKTASGASRPLAPPTLAEMRLAAQRVISQAKDSWAEVERLRTAGQLFTARDTARRLVATAADVPITGETAVAEALVTIESDVDNVLAEVATARQLPPAEAEQALAAVLSRVVDAAPAQDALARLPLAPPTGVSARVTDDAIVLSWHPSVSPGQIAYRLTRTAEGTSRGLGRTSATNFEDAGAPGGVQLRYQVTAVSGSRASEPANSEEVLIVREVEAVSARTARINGRAAVLISFRRPFGTTAAVAAERSTVDTDDEPLLVRAGHEDTLADTAVTPGSHYRYRVFLQYDANTRTPGRLVDITVADVLELVAEMWMTPRPDGSIRLSFDSPRHGEVWVFASEGEAAAPFAVSGTEVHPSALGSLPGVRRVGTGTRRVMDPAPRGRVVYTPVTVRGDDAVVGESLTVIAAPPVSGLTARDEGSRLVLSFQMPPGVTEAAVRWRFDRFAETPDEPGSMGTHITNTKLEIDGGLSIDVPDDGRQVYVTVYPAVRLSPSSRPVPATVATTLLARPGR